MRPGASVTKNAERAKALSGYCVICLTKWYVCYKLAAQKGQYRYKAVSQPPKGGMLMGQKAFRFLVCLILAIYILTINAR